MIRAVGTTILIKVKKEEPKAGKLLLPDDKDIPFRGIVESVGSKVDIDVEMGEELLILPYRGSRISMEDDGYLLISEKDVLGVIV